MYKMPCKNNLKLKKSKFMKKHLVCVVISPEGMKHWKEIDDEILNHGFSTAESKSMRFTEESFKAFFGSNGTSKKHNVSFSGEPVIVSLFKKRNAIEEFKNFEENVIKNRWGKSAVYYSDTDEKVQNQGKLLFPNLSHLWQ